MEIYRYVPAALLTKTVGEMCLEEFSEFLAKARYLEEVERNLYMQAIAELFGDN